MNKLLLFLIAFSLVFRFYKLTEIPKGIYVDEAAQGYNAYKLLTTGKDEHGNTLPLYLQSFGTYPPALYTYLAVVPIKIFGLSELALRISPAVFGALSILVLGACVTQLTRDKTLGLLASLMLSLNPGHWLLSHGFHEPSLGFLLFLLGLALIHKNILGGLLMLSLSSYAYQPQRLIIYFIVAWIIYRYRKQSLVAVFVFLISQIPQLSFESTARLSALQIKFSFYEFLSHYMTYFSPKNLFWLPDPDPQRSLPELSIFFQWQIIPLILGLMHIWRYPLLVITLLTAAIPAALTRDPFATIRASLILIPLNVILAWGLQKTKPIFILFLVLLSGLQLYRSFFVLLPNERATAWNSGYKELFAYLETQELPAVVDVDKPVYILHKFYSFKKQNIEFRNLVWEKDIYKKQLLVGGPLFVSQDQMIEHLLLLQKNVEGFSIYQTDPEAKCLKFADSACKNLSEN